MTYIVSSGALNSTHSLTGCAHEIHSQISLHTAWWHHFFKSQLIHWVTEQTAYLAAIETLHLLQKVKRSNTSKYLPHQCDNKSIRCSMLQDMVMVWIDKTEGVSYVLEP